jgi:hypothetical protein
MCAISALVCITTIDALKCFENYVRAENCEQISNVFILVLESSVTVHCGCCTIYTLEYIPCSPVQRVQYILFQYIPTIHTLQSTYLAREMDLEGSDGIRLSAAHVKYLAHILHHFKDLVLLNIKSVVCSMKNHENMCV